MRPDGRDEYPNEQPDATDLHDILTDRPYWLLRRLHACATVADSPQRDEGNTA